MPADFSQRRRRIYQDRLTATADFFKDMLRKPPFDAQQDVGRMQAALIDPELIEALAGMLDTYAIYGVVRDFERLDETKALLVADPSQRLPLDRAIPRDLPARTIANPAAGLSTDALIGRYFDWYIDVADVGDGSSGVKAFLARYPLLDYAMDTVTAHHQSNVKLACERIATDWNSIGAAFFPGDTITRLSEIRTTGSDFHKGGKQVLILSFWLEKADGLGRVVYKPSSVEIDCRIVGDSAAVNRIKPEGYTQPTSLTELMNRHSRRQKNRFTSAPLPTYTVLPYKRRSVKEAYGYIEFLTREPVVKGPFAVFTDIEGKQADTVSSMSKRDVRRSDWVVASGKREQVFYHQGGRLLAMAYAVSVSDLHVQNVIVHGKHPCLIDLEDALKHPMTSISETGLRGGLTRDIDPEGNVLEITATEGGLPRAAWVRNPLGKPATSRLFRWLGEGKPGRMVNLHEGDRGTRNQRAFLRGLIEGVRTLADPQCNADVVSWVKSLDSTIVRFVPVATGGYAPVGRDLFQKCCETAIDRKKGTVDFGEIAYTESNTKSYLLADTVVNRRREWQTRDVKYAKEGPLMRAWRAPPFFALEHPDHAWRDFLNCDVPAFYHCLGELELRNSAGAAVDVKLAVRWQSDNIASADRNAPLPKDWAPNEKSTYFPQLPIDMVVDQLLALARTCQDPVAEHLFLAKGFVEYGPALEKLLFPDAAAKVASL